MIAGITASVRNAGKRLYWKFRRIGKSEVLVIGDSHAAIFRTMEGDFPKHYFNVASVGGATISGLTNPNSVTQAMAVFKRALKASRSKVCIVLLGEVDTGFVIWYRAKKNGCEVDVYLEKAILNYQKFLDGISKRRRVICISAPLPTIRDGLKWGDVANKRKEVTATQLERTDLTMRFNASIQKHCEEVGICHINLDSQSVGDDGVVGEFLRNKSRRNHHYDPTAYQKLIIPPLREILER